MRHQKRLHTLGLKRDTRRLMLGNLATSIMIHEKIQTTISKAKAVQPLIEDLINTAKRKEKRLAIRSLNSVLHSELASKKVMEELIKRYAEKNSGYTRITPIKFRAGDAAEIVQIELV